MFKKFIIAIMAVVMMYSIAVAQEASTASFGFRGWGPRIGVTIDPDQFHFGGHADFGHFAKHIRLQPNLEIGFGDNLMLLAINFEGSYRFATNWDVWTPYIGAGPGINFYNFDDEGLPDGADDSETEFGFNILGGIEKGISNGDRFFLELKLGFADSPDIKITAGWTFFH
ncbi:MAG TPA: hypothetical protein ENO22_13165 [candidate division Zixibacteria bacterium]|mgnify:CR=1 FL=1|nr:hypothetical protein [candidate division Zixibacteria bacterium]HER00283.1 hypothetical protein [candidate division Zixibacteria bacterium]